MDIDAANKTAMADKRAVAHYAGVTYLDPGEAELYRRLKRLAGGQPLLDIGVGGGRTVEALRAVSPDYVGIDYTPEMVETCRRKFAGVRFEHQDARALAFPGEAFGAVVFSCAGLDMVSRADRTQILREVLRVLRPGGAFVFSTHNKDAVGIDFTLRRLVPLPALTLSPLKLARGALGSARRSLVRARNHWRLRGLEERLPSRAILNSEYHDFSTLMHFITAAEQRRELVELGFASDVTVLANDAAAVEGSTSPTHMFHVLARRPS